MDQTADQDVIPWYKSAVLKGIVAWGVTKAMAYAATKYHLDFLALGISADDLIQWTLHGISYGALAYAAHGRITRPSPPVAISKASAQMRNQVRMLMSPSPITAGKQQCAVQPSEAITMTPVLGNIGIDLLTGAILEQGTSGDKTKQAARATEALALIGGFKQILGGDPTGGINAIAAAVQANTALSIAENAAFQNLILLAGNQGALLANIGSGTLLGQAATALIGNALTEMSNVCNKYIAAAPPQAAKA